MVTERIEKAWEVYKKNFGPIAIAILLQSLISGIIISIGIVPWIFMIFFYNTYSPSMILSYLGLALFSMFFIAIGVIVSIVLNGGFTRMLYDAIKGKADYNTMFRVAKEKFWTILGANSVFMLIFLLILFVIISPLLFLMSFPTMISSESSMMFIILIFSIVIVGTIVMALVSALFTFINEAIVIDNLKAIDAIKKSIEVSRRCYIKILGLMLIFTLINSAINSLFSFIGTILEWFVTMPILFLCYIYLYLENRRK